MVGPPINCQWRQLKVDIPAAGGFEYFFDVPPGSPARRVYIVQAAYPGLNPKDFEFFVTYQNRQRSIRLALTPNIGQGGNDSRWSWPVTAFYAGGVFPVTQLFVDVPPGGELAVLHDTQANGATMTVEVMFLELTRDLMGRSLTHTDPRGIYTDEEGKTRFTDIRRSDITQVEPYNV